MTTKKRIYLSPPHMGGNEIAFVQDAFASNWIAPIGPHVDAFEKEFCATVGAAHAAAMSSGTAALHIALQLSGVNAGDAVACSTFTFAGSAFPITYCGAEPVFIDSEESSWNMDPLLLETAIKDSITKGKCIKAVIVVHLYGQSANMGAILDICKKYDIVLIEDAAESLGATYGEKHTGTIGKIGIYSFNGNKIITTSGGGMFVSSDPELVEKARFLATQARDPAPHYEHSVIGYNYRMSNVLAGIGRGQLQELQKRVDKKREIFTTYKKLLGNIPGISFMPQALYGRSNCWLTCINIDPKIIMVSPEQIRQSLEKENIESRPLWKPMHMQPVFENCVSYVNGTAEKLYATGLCLPSGTAMTEEDQNLVAHSFVEALEN